MCVLCVIREKDNRQREDRKFLANWLVVGRVAHSNTQTRTYTHTHTYTRTRKLKTTSSHPLSSALLPPLFLSSSLPLFLSSSRPLFRWFYLPLSLCFSLLYPFSITLLSFLLIFNLLLSYSPFLNLTISISSLYKTFL